jgi:hypothetical protein
MQQINVRVDSSEVQGKGSYVIMQRLTVHETKELMKTAAVQGEATIDKYAANAEWVGTRVVEWNWTDAAGNALPYPQNDPSVMDRLTNDELAFLGQAIVGRSEAERKN